MSNGQSSGFTWGGVLKGVAYVAGTIAVGIIVTAGAGFALTNLGTWMATIPATSSTAAVAGNVAVATQNAASAGAAATSGWVTWGTTFANLGASLSGISSWITETVTAPFTGLIDWFTKAAPNATYTAAAKTTLELGTNAKDAVNLAGNLTGSAARVGVGVGVGLAAAAANGVATRSERAAERKAVGKFTERVLQEEARAQLASLDRQV